MNDLANSVLTSDLLTKLSKSQQRVLSNARQDIQFAVPILTLRNQGVIFPNTINMIQGKSGVHKSRLVELVLAALLAMDKGLNFNGFKANIHYQFYGVYIDTERNLNEQFPYAIQQIKILSGNPIEENLENFDPVSLIDISREDRFKALKLYLENIRKLLPNQFHLFVILDVITDCIGNFNDPRQSMELIDLMNALINEHNLTFLCVIHENPMGNEKARGHLGTELFNKSSTVLQIGFESKDSELIKINFKKCRKTKRIEPFHLIYSEEAKRLVIPNESQVTQAQYNKKEKARVQEIIPLLTDMLIEPLGKTELIEVLKSHFHCGSRIIEDRLKQIYEDNLPIKGEGETKLILDKFSEKRKTFYALISPDQNQP